MAAKSKPSKAKVIEIARGGKDEMNLVEFPTAILTNRSPDGVKTLRFQDSHGQLTVTGSDALGLPTPIDTDVMVALIELTKKKNNFTLEKVNFTRYELIRLIGWANVGSSYDRLKESLDRWAGVLLIYDGCWWDNRLKQYVSKTLHIIEDVVIAEGKIRTEKDSRQETLPLSFFTWSSHFMESFQANNLKNLDTAFYFSLKLPTSKQLFRFLDKRFANKRPHWTFDLEELAFERVGLSRKYNATKIKEKLGDAISELEDNGFLKPLPREERYFKATGAWKIRFIDGRNCDPVLPAAQAEEAPPPLVSELVKRGVAASMAATLVQHFPEFIEAQLDAFDWLVEKKDKKISKNAAGYLIEAIKGNYPMTAKGYAPKAVRLKNAEEKRQAEEQAAADRRRKHLAEARQKEARKLVDAHLRQLSPEDRAALEATVLAEASPDMRENCEKPSMAQFRETFLLSMVRDYLEPRLMPQDLPLVDA